MNSTLCFLQMNHCALLATQRSSELSNLKQLILCTLLVLDWPLDGCLSTLCLSVTLVHSLHRSSSILFNNFVSVLPLTLLFSLNSKQSSFVHSLHLLNALLVELYKIFSNNVLCYVPSLHNLSSRVFSNSEDLLQSVNILVWPSSTFSSELKADFRYALLALILRNPEQFQQTLKDSRIYLHPADGNDSYTSTT